MLKVNSSFALGMPNAVISVDRKQKESVSFGQSPVIIPRHEMPKDINIARDAIRLLSHHLKPLAELTQEVVKTVPKGQRTAVILGKLFNSKSTISPCVNDCFKEQERLMVHQQGIPSIVIQEFRQNYNTLCGFVRDYGRGLKQFH